MQLSNELTSIVHKLLTAQIVYEKRETVEKYYSEVSDLLNKSFDLLIASRVLLKKMEAIRNDSKTV